MPHEIDSGKLWPDRDRYRERKRGRALSGSCLGLLMSHMLLCLGEAYGKREPEANNLDLHLDLLGGGGRACQKMLLTFRGLFKVGRTQKAK